MSFNNVFKGKNVIVTGKTGFKGAWLSIWLNNLGHLFLKLQKKAKY